MRRHSLAAVLGIGAVLLFAAAASAGGPPSPAAGAGTLGADTITSVQPAGPNLIVEGTTTGALGGTFDATFVESFRDVVHPDGSVNITGRVDFTGSTPCGTGTWTQRLVVQVAPDGTFSGQTATIDDASATVPLHTQYSFVGAGNAFAYDGTYHCG